MPSPQDEAISMVTEKAVEEFSAKHSARELGLRISREVIRSPC